MAEALDQEERRPAGRRRGRGGTGVNLVESVAAALRQAVESGEFRAGDRLPSEAGLTQRFQVSRTVVREAVASLRADGLLEARHGVGVFVLEPRPAAELSLQASETARISSIIEMLELRAAVEIEAAGLAAARRSPAQEEAIWERWEDIEALAEQGRPTAAADFEFHLAVAEATNNPRFRDFLTMMGRHVIPRAALPAAGGEQAPADYLRQIQAEHRRIAQAVAERDEAGARAAMREHLAGSRERYRSLIRRG